MSVKVRMWQKFLPSAFTARTILYAANDGAEFSQARGPISPA